MLFYCIAFVSGIIVLNTSISLLLYKIQILPGKSTNYLNSIHHYIVVTYVKENQNIYIFPLRKIKGKKKSICWLTFNPLPVLTATVDTNGLDGNLHWKVVFARV